MKSYLQYLSDAKYLNILLEKTEQGKQTYVLYFEI